MHILVGILTYKYVILLPLAMAGGPMLAFVMGAVARFGYVDPFIAYGVFVLGDFIPDTAYWALGHQESVERFLRRWGHRIGVTGEHFDALRALWQRRTLRTMVISKYAFALTGPMLMSAGVAKLPFRRYIAAAMLTTLVQYAVFLPLGYYFAGTFAEVTAVLRLVQIAAATAVLLALYVAVGRTARKRVFAGNTAKI